MTVLRRDGFTILREGARVVAEAQRRERGLQVFQVLAITEPDPAAAPDLPPPRTRAQASSVGAFEIVIVKWFNRSRGFGSWPVAEGTEDIFVHIGASAPLWLRRSEAGRQHAGAIWSGTERVDGGRGEAARRFLVRAALTPSS